MQFFLFSFLGYALAHNRDSYSPQTTTYPGYFYDHDTTEETFSRTTNEFAHEYLRSIQALQRATDHRQFAFQNRTVSRKN